MISRVETMVLMGMELPLEAVRRQIASGVELLVHLERARDGKRQVAEIAEILGYENGEVRMHGLYRREKVNDMREIVLIKYYNVCFYLAFQRGKDEINKQCLVKRIESGAATNGLFIGYAPADDPEIAVAVRIINGYEAGNAVECGKNIFEYYFGIE